MNEELFGELHEQEEYGLFGKEHERQQCFLHSVVLRSEQSPCGDCENYAEYDGGIKYCSVCGTKLS